MAKTSIYFNERIKKTEEAFLLYNKNKIEINITEL